MLAISDRGDLAYVAGPSTAGLLVQALTAPVAVLADAVSFVFSALMLQARQCREAINDPYRAIDSLSEGRKLRPDDEGSGLNARVNHSSRVTWELTLEPQALSCAWPAVASARSSTSWNSSRKRIPHGRRLLHPVQCAVDSRGSVNVDK